MKKIILFIVIAAGAALAVYFVMTQRPKPALAPQEETPAAEVIYTDAGYTPAAVRIKQGETVTFKNQSTRAMWTGSGAHPTHRQYPVGGGCLGSAFDACEGTQPGETWSFKFDVAGTWEYHNHLRADDTGVVIVE